MSDHTAAPKALITGERRRQAHPLSRMSAVNDVNNGPFKLVQFSQPPRGA